MRGGGEGRAATPGGGMAAARPASAGARIRVVMVGGEGEDGGGTNGRVTKETTTDRRAPFPSLIMEGCAIAGGRKCVDH